MAGSYRLPKMVKTISKLHMNEFFEAENDRCFAIEDEAEKEKCKKEQETANARLRFKGRLYSTAMALGAIGIFSNAVTGIWMALGLKKWKKTAIVLAALGLLVPAVVLIL